MYSWRYVKKQTRKCSPQFASLYRHQNEIGGFPGQKIESAEFSCVPCFCFRYVRRMIEPEKTITTKYIVDTLLIQGVGNSLFYCSLNISGWGSWRDFIIFFKFNTFTFLSEFCHHVFVPHEEILDPVNFRVPLLVGVLVVPMPPHFLAYLYGSFTNI